MSKCINCGTREATSWDGLWCSYCLGSEATSDDWNGLSPSPRRQSPSNKWYRSKRATKVFTDEKAGYNVVRYHNTDVVIWNDNEIKLDTGGYQTHTTKDRMNQVSREYDLGFYVYQKNFDWYVEYKGETIPFTDSTLILLRKEKRVTGKGLNLPDVWGVKKNEWPPHYDRYKDDLL